MSSGVNEISRSNQPFNEIIAIIGLPRSGTTLATSVFDAHPFTVACYEPWNRVSGAQLNPEQTPEDLIARFNLNAMPDANIFVVKETTVDFNSIQWLTKFLQHNAKTHRVQIVWSLRNYRHNYLSFVEGAREWWGHTDMKTELEGYTQWVERARKATATLMRLYQQFPGAIYAYESLAEDAPTTLPRLMEALDLKFSIQQVNYLQHYSPKQVRGDISMSRNPRPISDDSIIKRESEWDKHKQELTESYGDALRQELDQFWQTIHEQAVIAGQVPETLIPNRLKGLVFRPGHEYRETFSNKKDWEEFAHANSAVVDKGIIEDFAASISRVGFKFLDKPVKAADIEVVDGDYRNSFVYEGLASRNRAMIVELYREFLGRKIDAKNTRVYAPESSSGCASFFAGYFSKFQNSVCLPDQTQQKESASTEYQDLAALTFGDASFDYVVVDDIFQHVPNLDKVLREVHRVLAPGGALFATFPFAIDSEEHLMNTTLNTDRSVNYLAMPEDQQDAILAQREVVRQIPGWNILKECRNIGFNHAQFTFLSSPARGVLASDISGVMVLRAVKSA